MAMLKAYVLIETAMGTTQGLVSTLGAIHEVRSVHYVVGPYDIIAVVETVDLPALKGLLEDRVRSLPGVEKTTTCLALSQG